MKRIPCVQCAEEMARELRPRDRAELESFLSELIRLEDTEHN